MAALVGRVMAGMLQPGPHVVLREVAEVQLRLRRDGAAPAAPPLTAVVPEAGQMDAWTCGARPACIFSALCIYHVVRGAWLFWTGFSLA